MHIGRIVSFCHESDKATTSEGRTRQQPFPSELTAALRRESRNVSSSSLLSHSELCIYAAVPSEPHFAEEKNGLQRLESEPQNIGHVSYM